MGADGNRTSVGPDDSRSCRLPLRVNIGWINSYIEGMRFPSSLRAFLALVRLTFLRQWRVRALGWVTLSLVVLISTAIGIFTHGPVGWRLENQRTWVADFKSERGVRMTYQEYSFERLPNYIFFPGPPEHLAIKTATMGSIRNLMISNESAGFRDDYAFLGFSRGVIFTIYLGFILPLFALAFASHAIGSEREGRTLIWLVTRPLPRGSIYLAKFLGILPWCVAVSVLGLASVCLAGSDLGRKAFFVFLPSVLAGTIALAALFHLIGAVFRRPAIIGLVYVFFFETLVANLPGSLKRLSLNYYIRSMMYDGASSVAEVPAEQLDVYEPVSAFTAFAFLMVSTVVLTMIGMVLFARQEPREEI